MTFGGIVGQKMIIQSLKKAVQYKTVAHAYLFEGEKGLGKKEVAFYLATSLVCHSEKNKPCGICNACIRVSSGNYPEIKLIEGEKSIKVDEIREIIKDIQLKPYEGDKKIYIIEDADKMNIQSQNALLKTLEEPPSYATIILLTGKANSLVPTIVSRCQVIKFYPVSQEEIQRFLVEEKGIDKDQAKMIGAFSGGSIGKAKDLLENDDFYEMRNGIIKVCNNLMSSKILNTLDQISFFEENRLAIEEVLDFMISWYRDIMVYRETQSMDLVMNVDKIEEIEIQSSRIDLAQIRNIIFIIEGAKNNLKSNVQFHLNIEVMLLNIQEVISKW